MVNRKWTCCRLRPDNTENVCCPLLIAEIKMQLSNPERARGLDVTPPSAVIRLSPHSPSHAIKSATCQTLLMTSCVSHAQRECFYDGYRRNLMNWKQREILSNFLLSGLRWLLHWLLMQDDLRRSEERFRRIQEPEKPAINRLKAETISGNVGFRAYHTRNPFLVFLDCPSSSV